MIEEPEQESLDSDTSARTAMLFGLEMSREEACNILDVPWSQSEAWTRLWDALEQEATKRTLEG